MMTSWRQRFVGLAVVVVVAAAGGVFLLFYKKPVSDLPPSPQPHADPVDVVEQIHTFCGAACHSYPSPDHFPRKYWRQEVERGYRFFELSGITINVPPIDAVVRYYERLSPDELPAAVIESASRPLDVQFERRSYPGPGPARLEKFAISNVNLVRLPDPSKTAPDNGLDILACDMKAGLVMLLHPSDEKPVWKVIANFAENEQAPSHPAHTEVVDLDGDGILDVIVADLGSFPPTDRHCGRVVWLRGKKDGTFTPVTLLKDVGRVADVQAADFRGLGKGKLDLIVGAFGWQAFSDEGAGIFYLENQTTDWNRPKFFPKRLDDRHGCIHLPVADLNGDGKPDFVALFAQEHETVVAYVNQGNGEFEKKALYAAPDPSYGSSGIQLVDLNGDGKLDVLYSNGDTLDEPYLFKPYHGVQWLENKGDLKFEYHPVTPLYGIHRAVAGNVLGNGKKDIVAVSFLPLDKFPDRVKRKADAVIILEQTAPDKWQRHSLTKIDCDHVTCAVGDVYGTGNIDIVVGNFSAPSTEHPVTIWKNLGKK